MKKYKFPIYSSKDLEEKRLASLLNHFLHDNHDLEFLQTLQNKYGFKFRDEKLQEKAELILQFCQKYGYRPYKDCTLIENRLVEFAQGLETVQGIESETVVTILKFPKWSDWLFTIRLTQLRAFCKERGYLPKTRSSDKNEKECWSFLNGLRHNPDIHKNGY